MALKVEHEIHTRRYGRNLGVGVLLAGFVALVLALTVVKVTRGAMAPHETDSMGALGASIPDPAAKVSP